MKYFVTGATGFIGGKVARQLVSDGHEVVALVRTPEKAISLSRDGIALHRGDVTEAAGLVDGMKGCDGVFHLAGWYKVGARDVSPGRAINIEGTRNVLDAMREAGVPRGVYTSTLAVFSDTHGKMPDEQYRFTGRHISEYDRTKAAAHGIAEAHIHAGLPLIIVQPGLVYGPGDQSAVGQALDKYLRRKLPMLPAGSEYCWAHVDDIARAHILAMEKGRPGQNYIIAGPRHSLVDAMLLAQRLSGIPAPSLRAPSWMMRVLSTFMAGVEKVVPVPEDYSSEYLRVSAGVTYLGNNAKARAELGYSPRSLEEGLAETLRAEMQRLGMPLGAGLTSS